MANAAARRIMPAQKPGKSQQEVATPWDFIDAVEARFGRIDWDLAATAENCVVRDADGSRLPCFYSREQDSLKQDWGRITGLLYLNPEFADFEPWVRKAAEEATPTSRVLVLTKASVDSNWWWKWCQPHALTWALTPRITFVGHEIGFPGGLALHLFGLGATGWGRWRWKGKERVVAE
jgi:hypothetical protein